jgi:hypothetical protein
MEPALALDETEMNVVELMEVGGEWCVRTIEDGRETISWYQRESDAIACAEGWRVHLGLEKIDLL